jgi:hypothetical protein
LQDSWSMMVKLSIGLSKMESQKTNGTLSKCYDWWLSS